MLLKQLAAGGESHWRDSVLEINKKLPDDKHLKALRVGLL